jgi:hypothetical protein
MYNALRIGEVRTMKSETLDIVTLILFWNSYCLTLDSQLRC